MRAQWLSGKVLSLIVWMLLWGIAPAAAAPGGPLGWQALGSPPGPVTLLAMPAQDRQLGYAVSDGRALYRSHDGGATWQPATNNLPPGRLTAIYPAATGQELYAAVAGSDETGAAVYSLWRSWNEGLTWERVRLERADLAIRSIAGDAGGRYLYLGLAPENGSADSQVYRSADDGKTWESRPVGQAGAPLVELQADARAAGRLYVITSAGQLYRSTDSGATWQLVSGDAQAPAGQAVPARLAGSPEQPDVLFLVHGSTPALERSVDGGATWRRLPAGGLPAGGGANALLVLSPNVLLLNTDAGTYRSSDGGENWRLLEGPLSSGVASAFVLTSGARPEALAATGYGLYVSRDAGAVWQATGAGLPFNNRALGLLTDERQPRRAYAIMGQGPAGGSKPPTLLSSQDGGSSWQPLWHGQAPADPVAWALGSRASAPALYVAGPEGLWRSLDGGLTWQTSRLTVSPQYVAVAPSSPDIVYLTGRPRNGEGEATLLRSDDSGANWSESALPKAVGAVGPAGLAIDARAPEHVWTALAGPGIFESKDGGRSWQPLGLEGRTLLWVVYDPAGGGWLYAGIASDGIYRLPAASTVRPAWTALAGGLPEQSTFGPVLPDPRTPGALWVARQGGGLYRSIDQGTTWVGAAQGMGDNQAGALAIDYATPGGILAATERAGVWALRPDARPADPPGAVDARIEILWPHDGQPVSEAKMANLGVRLFQPHSLVPPPCSWIPRVALWQAVDTDPVKLLDMTSERKVGGQPASYWEVNDVDVRQANDPVHKLYYMVQVAGATTETSVWAHGADARTYFPQQDVPSGIATEPVEAVDARIQIVWPHDAAGNEQAVGDATYANVAVAIFEHGTRLSVPVTWRPAGLTLYGAWNQEVGQPMAHETARQLRQSGAVTYPVWEFYNVPVAQAADPANKLYLWVRVDGVDTHPTLWTHGADARTYFPTMDEPIQGCIP